MNKRNNLILFNRWLGCLRKLGDEKAEYWRSQLSLFETNPQATLLDLGCGDGNFTIMLAKKLSTSNVFGIDIVDKNVEQSVVKGIKCRQVNLDSAKFPFENDTFDAICASQILEHVSDTDGFIKEAYRILKPGGYIVLSTPNLASWHCMIFLIFGYQPAYCDISDEFTAAGCLIPAWAGNFEKNPGFPNHRRVFTLSSLKFFLKYHGFIVEKTAGSGYFPFPSYIARLICVIDKIHASYVAIKARKPLIRM